MGRGTGGGWNTEKAYMNSMNMRAHHNTGQKKELSAARQDAGDGVRRDIPGRTPRHPAYIL